MKLCSWYSDSWLECWKPCIHVWREYWL